MIATVSTRVRGLGEARRISAASDDVWVGYGAGIAHIDATTGSVVGLVDAAPGATGSLFATEDAVWVRSATQFLRRVDASTHTVTAALTAPERSGGSVVFGFGSVWTTAYDDDVLYRLRP